MIDIFEKAADIPSEWDDLCGDNYSAKKSFLKCLEVSNPCQQRYHLFRNAEGRADSFMITFLQRHQNIMTFTPFSYRVDVTFVSVPVSITRPGFVIGNDTRDEVHELLRKLPGYVIILNAHPTTRVEGFKNGNTSWQMALDIRWKTLDAYMNALRSHYRHRLKKAMKKGKKLSFEYLSSPSDFTPELYSLYENVYSQSRVQVEKLSIDFFRGTRARILVAALEGRPVGFVQMIENGGELIFEFVGLNYQHNQELDVYQNLLIKMVEYACVNNFSKLEMGQTAEESKLRLGASYIPLHLLIRHSNPFLNWFTQLIAPFIQYKPDKVQYNVFNGEEP